MRRAEGLDARGRPCLPLKAGLLAWAAQNGPVRACFGWTSVSQRLGGRLILLLVKARVGQPPRRPAGQPANRMPFEGDPGHVPLPVAWARPQGGGRDLNPKQWGGGPDSDSFPWPGGRRSDLADPHVPKPTFGLVLGLDLISRPQSRIFTPKSWPSGLGGPKWSN